MTESERIEEAALQLEAELAEEARFVLDGGREVSSKGAVA